MITLKHLDVACANYRLTDLLKEVSDEELENLLGSVVCDDLMGDRYKIYEALLTEVEYRQSDKIQSTIVK